MYCMESTASWLCVTDYHDNMLYMDVDNSIMVISY